MTSFFEKLNIRTEHGSKRKHFIIIKIVNFNLINTNLMYYEAL